MTTCRREREDGSATGAAKVASNIRDPRLEKAETELTAAREAQWVDKTAGCHVGIVRGIGFKLSRTNDAGETHRREPELFEEVKLRQVGDGSPLEVVHEKAQVTEKLVGRISDAMVVDGALVEESDGRRKMLQYLGHTLLFGPRCTADKNPSYRSYYVAVKKKTMTTFFVKKKM